MPIEILIIDPDIAFITVVRRALELTNEFTVRVFTSGSAGIESSVLHPPSVAVLDFTLRDMPVAELIKGLRKFHPALPIIVTPRTREHLIQGEDLGVQRSIGKPYLARQLLPMLRELSGVPDTTMTAPTPLPRSLPEAASAQSLQQTTTPLPEPDIPPGATMRDLIEALRRNSNAGLVTDTSVESPHEGVNESVASSVPDRVPEAYVPEHVPETYVIPVDMGDDRISEALIDLPLIAEQILKITNDDTIPLSRTSVSEVIKQAEIEKAERGYTVGLTAMLPAAEVARFESDMRTPDVSALDALPLDAEDSARMAQSVVSALSDMNAEAVESAMLALRFTQMTLDPALTATILSHGETLIAVGGELDTGYVDRIHEQVQELLHNDSNPERELIHDIFLDRGIEFSVFSRQTSDGMRLTLVFAPEISFRLIRNQALMIEQALIQFGDDEPAVEYDQEAEEESEQSALESHEVPTRTRPPQGLREQIAAQTEESDKAEVKAVASGFLWVVRSGELTPEIQAMIPGILEQITAEQGWKLVAQRVTARYVLVQVEADADLTAPAVVESLMFDSAELTGDPEIWSDSYLAVTSGRAITQKEIDTFLVFAQSAVG